MASKKSIRKAVKKQVTRSTGVKKQLPSPMSKATGITAKLGGGIGAVTQAVAGRTSGFRRRRRITPERLQRQILILKLKRKLSRLKYGGR